MSVRRILGVLKRDLGRLGRQRRAWVILLGLVLTPSLYAWFNINAFWDPYGSTGQIQVAVVNLDAGTTSEETGELHVGDDVVEQLAQNDQLGWTFMGESEAMRSVRSGESFAAIIIPESFSADLASIATGEYTQPRLTYFVNEKASAVAPKITDTGASQLEAQITGSFVSLVSETAVASLQAAGSAEQQRLVSAQDRVLGVFDDARSALQKARSGVADSQTDLEDSRGGVQDAAAAVTTADGLLVDMRGAVVDARAAAQEAQQQVLDFVGAGSTAYVDATAKAAEAAAKARSAVGGISDAVDSGKDSVDRAIAELTALNAQGEKTIERLEALLDDAYLDEASRERIQSAIDRLQQRNADNAALLEDLGEAGDSFAGLVSSLERAASDVETAAGDAADSAAALRAALQDQSPKLESAMSEVSAASASFLAAIDAQRDVLAQSQELFDALDDQIGDAVSALDRLDDDLRAQQAGIIDARTDVLALSSASVFDSLREVSGLDAEQIAAFMESPVSVQEHVLFPVVSYGAAVSALFTNLSLWIGAFMLVVVMRTEVDTEGLPQGLTVREAYLGRFLLLAVFAVPQALLVSIGNLVIGIAPARPVLYVVSAVLIGLAYHSIIYALAVSFGYIGKGIVVILAIMQIPGASGMYPIEMMPSFFKAIYPFLPFTYGIDALRETIGGFYDAHYARYLGWLAVFVLLAFVLGLLLRDKLSYILVLFNRRLGETELYASEEVRVAHRGYRLSHVVSALADSERYRSGVLRRSGRFRARYPVMISGAALAALVLAAVLLVASLVVPEEGKATLLGVGVLAGLVLCGYVTSVEYVRESLLRQSELGGLEDSELREVLVVNELDDAEPPGAGADARRDRDRGAGVSS